MTRNSSTLFWVMRQQPEAIAERLDELKAQLRDAGEVVEVAKMSLRIGEKHSLLAKTIAKYEKGE